MPRPKCARIRNRFARASIARHRPSLFANHFSDVRWFACSSHARMSSFTTEKLFCLGIEIALWSRRSEAREEMSHKPQIMVVDDDQAICEFLRMFLDGLG